MKTTALNRILAGVIVLGATSFCAAQQGIDNRPVITVTAGQGGYISLPDLRPQSPRYALTGEQDRTRQDAFRWQNTAGPRYRVGQAEITLPAAR